METESTPEPKSEKGSSLTYFNAIGIFIGTHGLAVFLVVYYTTVLYPRVTAERKEWIEEITMLRQLVNPETRPVNQNQAETILKIIATSFVEKLDLHSEYLTYQCDNPIEWDTNSITLWGDEYVIEGDELAPDPEKLRNLLKLFQEQIQEKRVETQRKLRDAYEQARKLEELQAYQLGLIKLERGSLREVWMQAEKSVRGLWMDEIEGVDLTANTFEVSEFRKFIATHKNYQTLLRDEPDLLKPFVTRRSKSINEVVEAVRGKLETELSRQLSATLDGATVAAY